MKIYIAEDEPLAAAKLKLFLEKLDEGGDISMFDNGISTLAAINRDKPDLVFLDIQMPGLTGMEILPKLHEIPVIITSAFDTYAIDSFNYSVTDYLLKPFTIERLKMAIDKAKREIQFRQFNNENNALLLSVRVEGKTEQIRQNDIIYVESVKDYVRIVTSDGQQRLTLGALSALENQLPSDKFSRVHRSFIINLSKVARTGPQSFVMIDGEEIPIGRKYKSKSK